MQITQETHSEVTFTHLLTGKVCQKSIYVPCHFAYLDKFNHELHCIFLVFIVVKWTEDFQNQNLKNVDLFQSHFILLPEKKCNELSLAP